jgi:chromosomal replication initiator protein
MSDDFSTDDPQQPGREPLPLGQAAWNAVAATLVRSMKADAYATFVAAARVEGSSDGVLRLSYPEPLPLDPNDFYRGIFEEELERACNRKVRVEFVELPAGARRAPTLAIVAKEPDDGPAEPAGASDDELLGEPLEQAAWRAVAETLAARMSPHAYRTYVAAARIQGSGVGLLRLSYTSQFLIEWVRENYGPTLEDELHRVCGRRVRIEYVEREPEPAPPAVAPPAPEARSPAARAASERVPDPVGVGEPPQGRRLSQGLDARYSLDTFVVGKSNQFAYAACKAVADTPGRVYNPLFLCGGVGLGKTHLMQAVGNKVLADRPDARIIYTSSEQFTNDLIGALQNKKMHEFRRKYRECDLLLIDDVQFLAGKPATEEEFFHTFNALYAQDKQIIVSSDTVPNDLKGMEERLRSRFQWGLIADVQPPELETRVAILMSKAAQMGLALPDDVARFLGVHVRQNVRELEGSLTRIAAFANLTRGPITVDLCKDVLRTVLVNRGEKVGVEQITKACADHFKVTVADIKGPRRTQQVARARQVAMYLTRQVAKLSFPEIGRQFGGRDHSTVINNCDRVVELMADPDFHKSVETLERQLTDF